MSCFPIQSLIHPQHPSCPERHGWGMGAKERTFDYCDAGLHVTHNFVGGKGAVSSRSSNDPAFWKLAIGSGPQCECNKAYDARSQSLGTDNTQ